MPDDRNGGGKDDSNVVYLPQTKDIDVFPTGAGRPAGRRRAKPTRRWRSAVILGAVAFVAAMLVATGEWTGMLVLAAIAGVIVLGASLTRKRGPGPRRGLRRPRARIRDAEGDRRMELHVWCEFEVDHEPSMIEAVEMCLENLYEDEDREGWKG